MGVHRTLSEPNLGASRSSQIYIRLDSTVWPPPNHQPRPTAPCHRLPSHPLLSERGSSHTKGLGRPPPCLFRFHPSATPQQVLALPSLERTRHISLPQHIPRHWFHARHVLQYVKAFCYTEICNSTAPVYSSSLTRIILFVLKARSTTFETR